MWQRIVAYLRRRDERALAADDERMKVLHLTGELPYLPGASGGSTRQFHLLSGLAEQGHEVTVVAPVFDFQHEQVDLQALYSDAGMRLRSTPRVRARQRQLLDAVRRRPSLALHMLSLPYYGLQAHMLWTSMAPAVFDEMQRRPPDVVTVEHDFNASWEAALPLQARPPLALTLQNVTSDYYRSRADATRGIRSAAYAFEQRRMARYARRYMPQYDLVVTVSDRDAELAAPFFNGPITVVPNGTDVHDEPLPDRGTRTVLFTGTMSHPPNREGLHWFVENVWPSLRRQHPDLRLQIVGRQPQRDILDLASDRLGIDVTGEVATMLPYYEQAAVVIAPVFSGGGTRLKILDALAVGRAVVATTVAAEGLDVLDGRDLLIRDAPATFAAAVGQLLDNSARRQEMAAAGWRVVRDRYDWRNLARRWSESLEDVVDIPSQKRVVGR
jgi:glycosyltransferase involved in cell wall biosynthesis